MDFLANPVGEDISHNGPHPSAPLWHSRRGGSRKRTVLCVLENTHQVGALYSHYSVIQGSLWINCVLCLILLLQEYKKKMKFLNQFVCFSRKCLEGRKRRVEMLMKPGVWSSLSTDSSS